MANICTINYVIEGEKQELDALYGIMKDLQEKGDVDYPVGLGSLVEALGRKSEDYECRGGWTDLERQDNTLHMTFETAWTPCFEVTALLKEVYPSIRIYYKAEEPGCEVYMKNDAEGKYFPETEADGHPFNLMTEEDEQKHALLVRGIHDGSIKIVVNGKE